MRRFDASLAGLGGCPFAPGASGNIVMDDLVFMLDSMGLRTGIDLEKLMRYVRSSRDAAGHRDVRRTARAGLPQNYVSAERRHAAAGVAA